MKKGTWLQEEGAVSGSMGISRFSPRRDRAVIKEEDSMLPAEQVSGNLMTF